MRKHHKIPLFRVKISVAPSGERWALLVDARGMAEEHSTLFATMVLRERGLSYNSQCAYLRAIATFLSWAQGRGLDVNSLIGQCDLFDRNEVHDLKRRLRHNGNVDKAESEAARKRVKPVVCHATYYNRVHFVTEYVRWHAEHALSRVSTREHARAAEMRHRIDDFRNMMTGDLPKVQAGEREAASKEERQAMLEAIRPGSAPNPFPPYLQHRNEALILLFETLGLRRGEVLALLTDDLAVIGPAPTIKVIARKERSEDPRPMTPRVKTLDRKLPLDKALAEVLRVYLVDHRSKLPGAKRTKYVFLKKDGKPLSLQGVNEMYRLLRERVPGVSPNMSPHVSRHDANETFSDVAEEQGMSEAEERQLRNYAMGWGKMSTQGERYNRRRTRKKAGEASLSLQRKSFEGDRT